MQIESIHLDRFRNHISTTVEWAPRFNVILGPNGAGKTSLIDAIHLLCMSRSFVTASDGVLPTHEERHFQIEGAFSSQARSAFRVKCFYSRSEGKSFFVNDSPLEKLSDLIGMVPVVVMSPEDHRLTGEGPVERRSFLDAFISQLSSLYLKDLLLYRRIRRQRNSLLQQSTWSMSALRPVLEPWNVQLAQVGTRIIRTRAEVLERFTSYLEHHFGVLSERDLAPGLRYRPFCEDPSADPTVIEAEYLLALDQAMERELERRQTLVGPHRDEVQFFLNGIDLRKFGSQGQHRLFSMALKLAQFFYYADHHDDTPILLLDDVFGNLDTQKTRIMVELLLGKAGQTFITSASKPLFQGLDDVVKDQSRWFSLQDAAVSSMEV